MLGCQIQATLYVLPVELIESNWTEWRHNIQPARRTIFDDPRFDHLRDVMDLRKYQAAGVLELMFHFCAAFTPAGNIGKYSDADIENFIQWKGEPGALVAALVQTGWLQESATCRLALPSEPFMLQQLKRVSLRCGFRAVFIVPSEGANVEKRDFIFKIKSIDDAGNFTGMAATYGNVDLGGDRIIPGAFSKTLSAGRKFPVLWQHDPSNPIGTCEITDSRDGLQLAGALELSDPTAKKAHTFMKAQVVRGLSIGYDTVQSTYDGDVRNLTEVKLWEVSVVTFPMNESAMVTGIKAMTDTDRDKHLRAIDTHRKTIDRAQRAIRMHLKSLSDAFDDDPDDLALIEDEGDDEEMDKSFLMAELKKLAEQASALTV
jgi:uncharacterized protein